MATLNTTVNLGDLKQIVKIERVSSQPDESGFQQDIWEEIVTTRCKVEFDDRLMREVFKDQGVNSTIAKIFTCRYVPDIKTTDRLVFKGDAYEIYGINNVNEQDRFLKIWARMIC